MSSRFPPARQRPAPAVAPVAIPLPDGEDTADPPEPDGDERRLIAAGRTDREIAETLVVSRLTVNGHVAKILAKLGISTRRDAASRAREWGWLPMGDE